MPGPAPKRDAERTRNNTPASGAARQGMLQPVKQVNADRKKWHPRATAWFEALKTSGQASFYQDSDWAQAKIVADILTKIYNVDFARSAQLLETAAQMMSKLGTTEGDRRATLRVELEAPAETDSSTGELAGVAYLKMLGMKQPS